MNTGRIRELFSQQIEQQRAFAKRKAQITSDPRLTDQGRAEPLARLERERSAQAGKAWGDILATLQAMRDMEAAPLTAEETAQLATAAQIIAHLDPNGEDVDAPLDAVLAPFRGRIPAQRVIASALRKHGFTERAGGIEGRIYDPAQHYNALAYYAQGAVEKGTLSELNESFRYLDAIDNNAPTDTGSAPIVPTNPNTAPGVNYW